MRGLIAFWAVLLALLASGAATLQFLGAPPKPALLAGEPPPAQVAAAPLITAPAPDLPRAPTGPTLAGASPRPEWDGRIPAPIPALLEPSRTQPGASLPRIAADGRLPMQAYARPFDAADTRPRIGLLIAGLGLSEAESREAIENLPGPVSFAVSAYAPRIETLLQAVRERGHEILVSIPMESSGYPLNDAGTRSLLTGAGPDANQRNLETVLGRAAGYVGATGASDGMRGERFVQLASSFGRVTDELTKRGLLYIDPRPPAPGLVPVTAQALTSRAVDLVIDDPATRAEIEAKLAQLERIARDRGSALGLASALRPVTLDRLAAWARTVEMRGFVLAPVSALVQPAGSAQAAR